MEQTSLFAEVQVPFLHVMPCRKNVKESCRGVLNPFGATRLNKCRSSVKTRFMLYSHLPWGSVSAAVQRHLPLV